MNDAAPSPRFSGSRLGFAVAFAFVYFGAAKVGLSLAELNASASPVWPPTGIAIAGLLLLGPGLWPAVLAGAFAANFTTTGNALTSFVISAGNTAEAIIAVRLMQRYAGGTAAFDRARDVFRFVGLAAFIAPLASSGLGIMALSAAGLVETGTTGVVWLTWWLGDAVGALVVAPAIVLWARRRALKMTARRRFEALVLYVLLLATAGILFGGTQAGPGASVPVGFIFVPFFVWAAFRFTSRETATVSVILSTVAIVGTAGGHGPFAIDDSNTSLLLLQTFLGIGAIVGLSLASLVHERQAGEADLRRSRDELEGRVSDRTASLQRAVAALEGEVAERRRVEETLRQSEKALLEAQKIAHVGSWTWDIPSGRIRGSDELYSIYGLDRRSFDPTIANFMERVHPDDRASLQDALDHAASARAPFAMEYRILRPDGTERVVEARGEPVFNAAGAVVGMTGTGQDVTEIRAAEAAQREAQEKLHEIKRLETLDKFKTQFMNTAAHELGTPLTPILLQLHMLRRQPHSPDEAASLAILERNANRLRTLVADLLDGSRLQAGRMTLRKRRVDLGDLVKEAVKAYEASARDSGVNLEVANEPGLWVEADPERIGQVLDNLISNAIKFTPAGGHVDVSGQHGGDGVVVKVRDTGVGIQDADLDKIFRPFSRVATHGEHVREGTGLGLYLSRGLVELHGGVIGVDSLGPGQGSTFSFVLPVEEPERRSALDAELPSRIF